MNWPSREQYVGESILWELDVAARLAGSATVAGVGVATLLDTSTNQFHAAGISGAASTSGTMVRQKVTALVAGKRYFLTIPFTDSASNTQVACLFLECAL